ncbi:MAG: dehydrogenase [Saprospiraceae bacterium]|nr:dehydrogenase [Saprospiraceae bacterium]
MCIPPDLNKSSQVSAEECIALFSAMDFARVIEERMLLLLRKGKISKWFSGIGQEAISVGVTRAVANDDMLFPLHRNLGVFISRGVPLLHLLAQWQGSPDGFTKGRDRSFHFGSLHHHIVGMISHLGAQLSVAVGTALAYQLAGKQNLSIAFTGEGGTSEGEFHEALNLASVWQLPIIFVIENNGYALSTPTKMQYRVTDLAERGVGYGIKSFVLDGNNVLEIYQFVKSWASSLRKHPEPILVECKTFRMRGHEEASGIKYVPQDLLDQWVTKDPLDRLKNHLLTTQLCDEQQIAMIHDKHISCVDSAIEEVYFKDSRSEYSNLDGTAIYAPNRMPFLEPVPGDRTLRYIDAILEALDQAMQRDERLVLMGQDIGHYGGVFKATAGLLERYGSHRVRDTPLCESAVIGAALGLTFEGYHAMVEMQFADFISCGFNQLVNNLAKTYFRWGHAVNATIRLPTGGNVQAGPFHSQNPEAWFLSVPGLKIVYPSTAFDAKGLLTASLNDPNPVLFFEHKYLYRSQSDGVPKDEYSIPIGKAKLVRSGQEAVIITYGLAVHWALELVTDLDVDVAILDLRSLLPLDYTMIGQYVDQIGKVLILHEASLTGGVGAEISAFISEHHFNSLDAPIVRCASLDMPVPFAQTLEQTYLPKDRLRKKLNLLLSF